MLKKLSLILIATAAALLAFAQASPGSTETRQPQNKQQTHIITRADYSAWFIEDETSTWTQTEREAVEEILANTFSALESIGLNGEHLLSGYGFRRFAGEYAKNQDGKIALVNHDDGEIILSDTVMVPENAFFIYHELGHIIDHRSNRVLDTKFHALTLEIEGVITLHDWTTAQGFFIRGQAHIKHTEATADAFALWVWVDFAGQAVPHFHDTPENADPAGILEVIRSALEAVSGDIH